MRILIDSRKSAAEQMAVDNVLARQVRATLRFFRWSRPSVSVGFKQRPPAWVHPATLARHGIESVERPTGGGVAIHGSDLSFSVVAPHDPYVALEALLQGVADALQGGVSRLGVRTSWTQDAKSRGRIDYCLTEESPYALMAEGRKLCGLALRRYPVSWLIQGSLLVRELPPAFAQVMPAEVLASFQARAISLEEAAGRAIAHEELIERLLSTWPLGHLATRPL